MALWERALGEVTGFGLEEECPGPRVILFWRGALACARRFGTRIYVRKFSMPKTDISPSGMGQMVLLGPSDARNTPTAGRGMFHAASDWVACLCGVITIQDRRHSVPPVNVCQQNGAQTETKKAENKAEIYYGPCGRGYIRLLHNRGVFWNRVCLHLV